MYLVIRKIKIIKNTKFNFYSTSKMFFFLHFFCKLLETARNRFYSCVLKYIDIIKQIFKIKFKGDSMVQHQKNISFAPKASKVI